LEMGRELNVPLPTTAVTNEMFTAARGTGLTNKDFAVVLCWHAWLVCKVREGEPQAVLSTYGSVICAAILA
jgi:hypothetical protein